MAAKEVSVKEELKYITECCICINTFVDPRILPCIHTFCRKCLEKTRESLYKKSGDEMPCPVCRIQFTIPVDGFSGLQKSLFIERIIKVSNKLNLSKIDNVCDSCLEENDPLQASNVPSAETYCKDCQQKLCNDCTKHHKKNKVTKTHRIVEIDNIPSSEDLLEMIGQPSYCDIHSKELLKIYCSDCNAVVCSLCFVKSHRRHIGEDASEAVQEFIKYIGDNLEKIGKYTVKRKKTLENAKMETIRKIGKLEKEVIKTSEEIKKRVDEDMKSLITELGSIKLKILKEIEIEQEDVDICRTAMESYIRYSNELKTRGSPSDICCTFNDLNSRSKELNEMHDCLIQRQILSSVCISFEKSQLWQQSLKINNIVGEFKDSPPDANFPIEKAVLVKTIDIKSALTGNEKMVNGFAILNEELFILNNHCLLIEVYDSNSYHFKRSFNSKRLSLICPMDMGSCKRNNCLYIWNGGVEANKLGEILKVNPTNGIIIKEWSTGEDNFGRLSVTDQSNVILTVHKRNKLIEYSPEGQLIREIKLPTNVVHPLHAIKLANDRFVVSFGYYQETIHGVVIIDANGCISKSFGGDEGPSKGQLNVPVCLAVSEDGFILVADWFNNRISLLSSNLELKGALISKEKHDLRHTLYILSMSNDRLILVDCDGNWKNGRVLIFQY